MGCIIRHENKHEERIVENLVRESFWNVYRPGCLEHYVLHVQRECDDFVKELNLVMEKDGVIIGQCVFVKGKIDLDNGEIKEVLAVGPICIKNDLQKKGYGKLLLDYAIGKATELGYGGMCLEGNFDFYSKCGFVKASEKGLRYKDMPEDEEADFFLIRELKDGYFDNITGEYGAPEIYYVSENEVEEFDKEFPEKEKLKLPGQLFD